MLVAFSSSSGTAPREVFLSGLRGILAAVAVDVGVDPAMDDRRLGCRGSSVDAVTVDKVEGHASIEDFLIGFLGTSADTFSISIGV